MAVLNAIDLTGASPLGWDEAAHEALREAAKTLRLIQRMDVIGRTALIEDGRVVEYRTQVRLFFQVDTAR